MQRNQWNTRTWVVTGLVAGVVGIGVIVGSARRTVQPGANPPPSQHQPTTVAGPVGPTSAPSPKPIAPAPPIVPAAPPPLPDHVALTVPFAEQAPHRIWDHDHEELCEEAASLMVGRYFAGRSVGTADDVDAALFALKDWEIHHLAGTWEDTNAAQTAGMIRDVYGLTVSLKTDPTVDELKRSLVDGKLVVVPTAGRKLGNPNFSNTGPLYHMIVLTGYSADGQFITNDPGIWQGHDWPYSADVLMSAIGDWNNGDPQNGPKTVLIVKK